MFWELCPDIPNKETLRTPKLVEAVVNLQDFLKDAGKSFKELFRKANQSPLLNGKKDGKSFISFSWLMDIEHAARTLEGAYDELWTSKEKKEPSNRFRNYAEPERPRFTRFFHDGKWIEESGTEAASAQVQPNVHAELNNVTAPEKKSDESWSEYYVRYNQAMAAATRSAQTASESETTNVEPVPVKLEAKKQAEYCNESTVELKGSFFTRLLKLAF